MAIELILNKNLNGFEVADISIPEFDKLKYGSEYKATLTKPRNLGYHKKFYALLNLAFRNSDFDMSFEDFRSQVIMRAKFYDSYVDFVGRTIYKAKSISFAKMDETTFNDLFNRAIDVILEYVLIGSDKDKLIEEVIRFS